MTDPRPILIDCDPGIDDAVALLLAFACPSDVSVAAITTVAGNVPLTATTRNACRVRALVGRDPVPVHAGCARPLVAAPHHAAHVHGGDGLGGVDLAEGRGGVAVDHGVDVLLRAAADESVPSVVAVGPLTNLAVALAKRPEATGWMSRPVIMGGGLDGGNVTPAAEFNIFADPEAAYRVLTATDWPAAARPVLFPLDATRQALITEDWIDRLAVAGGPICAQAATMLRFYLEAVGARYGGVHVHDAMAVAWTIRPELFELRPARLEVLTDSGPERGRTVADFASREPTAEVVTDLDAAGFLDWLFEQLVALDG